MANTTNQPKINSGTALGFRHFTFIIRNNLGIDGTKPIIQVELNINPEDLQHETPYRVQATQTLGGAFVDVWGEGIKRIVLRGHTGWHRQTVGGQSQDGFENIFSLRDDVINKYFELRDKATQTKTQKEIEKNLSLTIIDRLHEKAYRVVPEGFKLMRNRARPLLHMYEASFVIVNNPPDETDFAFQIRLSDSDKTKALWDGFDKVESRFDSLKDSVKNIKGPFQDALKDITTKGGGISGMFKNILAAKNDLAKGVAGVKDAAIQSVSAIHAAMGTMQSYIDFSGITADARYIFNDVKSVTGDLLCLLHHIESFGLYTYSGINGASGCAALYGIPASQLATTTNSFDAIKQGTTTSKLQDVANSISTSSLTSAKKILSSDTVLNLIGRG